MASTYGVPEGSSLADWPIDYDALAPWYARAESEIGVAGELGHAHHGPRDAYPMPPFPLNADGRVLRDAARRLDWRTASIPLAINTRRVRRTRRLCSMRYVCRLFMSEQQQERHAQHRHPARTCQRAVANCSPVLTPGR